MTRATSRFLSFAILFGAAALVLVGQGAVALVQPYSAQMTQNAPGAASSEFSPLPAGATNTGALNWAGYVSASGTYTSVSGSWVVPTVADAAENVADATWVGIGGVRGTDLIQAGTEALPSSDGRITYQAWFETLPQDSQVVPLSISPGDSVSVSITQTQSGEWLISFDDATTGQTYRTTVDYGSSLSSAEWIEEMPVEVGGIIGLDDFGSIVFTGGYAIENGEAVSIAASGGQALTMDNATGQAIATPSQLGADGSSFTVSRTSAQATPLALTRGGVRAVAVSSALGSSHTLSGAGDYGYGYGMHMRGGFGRYRIAIQF